MGRQEFEARLKRQALKPKSQLNPQQNTPSPTTPQNLAALTPETLVLISVDDINPALPGALDYGNYGMFLIMGNAGYLSSTVVQFLGSIGLWTFFALAPSLKLGTSKLRELRMYPL